MQKSISFFNESGNDADWKGRRYKKRGILCYKHIKMTIINTLSLMLGKFAEKNFIERGLENFNIEKMGLERVYQEYIQKKNTVQSKMKI